MTTETASRPPGRDGTSRGVAGREYATARSRRTPARRLILAGVGLVFWAIVAAAESLAIAIVVESGPSGVRETNAREDPDGPRLGLATDDSGRRP